MKVLILAAGKGSRMNSDIPKVLIELDGKPLVVNVAKALQIPQIEKIGVIVSNETEAGIRNWLGNDVSYILQNQPLGTGHAVMCAESWLTDFRGDLIIVVGDAPFITKEVITKLIHQHQKNKSVCTLLSAIWNDPPPYGRIVRNKAGKIIEIVEEKDATEDELQIKELSSSHYCFNYPELKKALKKIDNNNAQNEFYLPDVIGIFIEEGKKVEAIPVDNPMLTFGINTKAELNMVKNKLTDLHG
jgi:UDP-N-acetylglucosamine diphosphorylase/glucosamine-1-phosphate N-acetyltransferase